MAWRGCGGGSGGLGCGQRSCAWAAEAVQPRPAHPGAAGGGGGCVHCAGANWILVYIGDCGHDLTKFRQV